jgi:LuxR family maltose regulon positive regulatory protein
LQKDSLNGYTDVFEYWFACLTLARIDIAQDRLDEALERLRRLLQDAEAAGGHNYVIASLALQAIVLQAQGKLDQALTALERALLLAEPEGYVRTFIDEGALMGELLRQAATQRIAPEYVDRLLAELAKETKDKQPEELSRDLGRASPHLVESLSERELEVLRLLAAGLSNREIAEGLYLSINTVKTHTKSIYSKLNVRSRVQAVNRAEELGIL